MPQCTNQSNNIWYKSKMGRRLKDYLRRLWLFAGPGRTMLRVPSRTAQPEQVQLTVPDSVGFPGLTAVALAKVKVPEPLASMVTETVAFGESGS